MVRSGGANSEMEVNSVKGSRARTLPDCARVLPLPKELPVVAAAAAAATAASRCPCTLDERDFPKNSAVRDYLPGERKTARA